MQEDTGWRLEAPSRHLLFGSQDAHIGRPRFRAYISPIDAELWFRTCGAMIDHYAARDLADGDRCERVRVGRARGG